MARSRVRGGVAALATLGLLVVAGCPDEEEQGKAGATALEIPDRLQTGDAVVLMDAGHHVTGVSVAAGAQGLTDAVTHDIEHFFDSLAREAARQTGR